MEPFTLKEDLILDFQEQKKALAGQIDLIDPMANNLRKPAVRRMLDTGFLIFMEVVVWALVLCFIAFLIFMDKLYPFMYLNDLNVTAKISDGELQILKGSIKGIAVLGIIFLIIISRMLRKIRLKNNILNFTGKNLRLLSEELLKRKSAMNILMEKHAKELPADTDTVVLPPQKPHNDTLL